MYRLYSEGLGTVSHHHNLLTRTFTPVSPSMSLADFDYDSESPARERPNVIHVEPAPTPPSPPIVISIPESAGVSDAATKNDIASLCQFIQHEFEQLRLQRSNSQSHPPVEVPKGAFTDALRAEVAVQLAKISALEEDNRRLRAEKQELREAFERAENQPGLQAELNAANQELKRVYAERQDLWEERAALWKERADLWEERADLWKERGSLWALRDELLQKINLLEAMGSQ
ncbi:hypothetical protein OPQ81_008155 [Rhizoctonia solani]|nr:hypothetical protein OPQ81_008155 [Rhizoctonia solani]